MPVYITSLKISDDYTGLISGNGSDVGLTNLKGCIGDFMYAKIDFNIAWNTIEVPMTFVGSTKTITRNECGIIVGSFISDGYKIGDSIVISGTSSNNGTFTVTNVTNLVITVSESVTNETASSVTIRGATPIQFFDFYYNLINNDNGNSFASLLDGKSLQKFTGECVGSYYGNTNTLSPNSTNLSWYVDYVDGISCNPTVEALGTSGTYEQQFEIIFPFLITPFFLAEQLISLQNSLAQSKGTGINTDAFNVPDLFPLKFICQIDAKFDLNEVVPAHSSNIVTTNFNQFGFLNQSTFGTSPNTNPPFEAGNTAWFNTFFPTAVKFNSSVLTTPQYLFNAIAYDDGSGNTLDSLDINNPTHVQLRIEISDTVYLEAPYVLNFMWLPTNRGSYSGYSPNNQKYFRKVFLHDRAKTQYGAAAVNGDMFGTSTQAITDLTAAHQVLYGVTYIVLDFTIDFGSFSQSTLEDAGDNNRNYLLWVTPQNPNVTNLDEAQRTAVIGDVNSAFIDTDEPTIFAITTDVDGNVLFYNPSDVAAGKTDVKDAIGGYDWAKCIFKVQEGCIIQDVTVSIDTVIKEAGVEVGRFNLQQWAQNTSNFYDGNITQVDILEEDIFTLPADTSWNIREIIRQPLLDAGGYYYCLLMYVFQIGFQYWNSVINYSSYFANYATQYWPAYTQNSIANVATNILPAAFTSEIEFSIKWNILNTATDIVTTFNHTATIEAYDTDGVTNTTTDIYFYDVSGNDITPNILVDAPTSVIAVTSGTFVTGDATLILYYQAGDRLVTDRINSKDLTAESDDSVWDNIFVEFDAGFTLCTVVGMFDFSRIEERVTNVRLIVTVN